MFGDDPAFEFTSSNSIYSCNGSDNSQPIRYVDCYDEIVRKRCCETCSSFYIGITGMFSDSSPLYIEMAGILPIWHKTQNSQSINSWKFGYC